MDEITSNRIFGQLDTSLQYINKNFISLKDQERKTCVGHFTKVLDKLVLEMKTQDVLFEALFERVCGAGSYFDGLRVAAANEFDMDVVMRLPINYSEMIIENEDVPPAFVKVKITKVLDLLRQHPRWTSDYRGLDKWRDSDGYLLQTKFRTWMEGVVQKTLNTLPKVENNRSELTIVQNDSNGGEDVEVKYSIFFKKSGPAMTLNISMPGNLPNVDVDLVPVLEFKHPQWPPKPVKELGADMAKKRPAWFIVPKPKNAPSFKDYFWRLAFHYQEREMLHSKACLKPVCRLLKKFRDSRGMCLIASYYIKTLFLWEVQENKDPELWKTGITKLFFHMLQKLHQSLKDGCIYYFWDKRFNLLEGMTKVQLENYAGNLANVMKNLKKRALSEPENIDTSALAEYLLTKSELEKYTEGQTSMLGTIEASSQRSLTRSNTNSTQNEVQNGRVNLEQKDSTDNQASTLVEMKRMMSQMQNIVLQSNATVVQILKRVEQLEEKIDNQLAKIVHLDDQIKQIQQSRLPRTGEQQTVDDFLKLNTQKY